MTRHYRPATGDPDRRERDVEATLRRRVRKDLGGRVIKLAPVEKGIPDRLVLLPGGRLQLVEVKRASGQLSPAQREWMARAAELDVPVAVVYGTTGVSDWILENLERN